MGVALFLTVSEYFEAISPPPPLMRPIPQDLQGKYLPGSNRRGVKGTPGLIEFYENYPLIPQPLPAALRNTFHTQCLPDNKRGSCVGIFKKFLLDQPQFARLYRAIFWEF